MVECRCGAGYNTFVCFSELYSCSAVLPDRNPKLTCIISALTLNGSVCPGARVIAVGPDAITYSGASDASGNVCLEGAAGWGSTVSVAGIPSATVYVTFPVGTQGSCAAPSACTRMDLAALRISGASALGGACPTPPPPSASPSISSSASASPTQAATTTPSMTQSVTPGLTPSAAAAVSPSASQTPLPDYLGDAMCSWTGATLGGCDQGGCFAAALSSGGTLYSAGEGTYNFLITRNPCSPKDYFAELEFTAAGSFKGVLGDTSLTLVPAAGSDTLWVISVRTIVV